MDAVVGDFCPYPRLAPPARLGVGNRSRERHVVKNFDKTDWISQVHNAESPGDLVEIRDTMIKILLNLALGYGQFTNERYEVYNAVNELETWEPGEQELNVARNSLASAIDELLLPEE